jgi:hypothetical protein
LVDEGLGALDAGAGGASVRIAFQRSGDGAVEGPHFGAERGRGREGEQEQGEGGGKAHGG